MTTTTTAAAATTTTITTQSLTVANKYLKLHKHDVLRHNGVYYEHQFVLYKKKKTRRRYGVRRFLGVMSSEATYFSSFS
ncbi:hypothetical protein AC249_AIPGENE18034 [Exaiptasia diaphana]|nr:hypothetical protein AC249_AIPGENE18034 [Exaiptasia diaphana]